MIHLKSTPIGDDSYEKQIIKSSSVEIEKNNDSNFYEIEKIIVKRKMYIERKRRRRAFSQFRMK